MPRNAHPFLLVLISSVLLVACSQEAVREVNLEPGNKRPLYKIQVADADEVAILQEKMSGLEVQRMEGSNLYFTVQSKNLLDSLRNFGYTLEPADPYQVFAKVVKVSKRGEEAELLKSGVQIINREEKFWIVRGNLTQLQLLRARGYSLSDLDTEVRPREVEIQVKAPDDVQRVANLGVDIFTTKGTRERGLVISGAAFDYQIDSLRAMGFTVSAKPYPGK
ncbi:MAG: hypothetical protein HY033_13900 [Ignavibacteriae bacterium]|nr:hypothetical protein [Ignavibacteriota bacterium]